MNLPLHTGWLGAFEAGGIAFVMGVLAYLLFHAFGRRAGWKPGHAIGWACIVAITLSGGLDIWNLFYISVVRLESPLYARIALQGIHDADHLAIRVTLEILFAALGAVLAWVVLEGRESTADRASRDS